MAGQNRVSVGQGSQVLFLGNEVIQSLDIGILEMADAVEQGFKQKHAGLAQFPPKPTIHPRPDCFFRALVGYLGTADVAGLKWVAAYPVNRQSDLPLVSGLIMLSDPETGLPLVIMNADWITAQRTAAVSAVAAKYLAPEGATDLAICGAGVQGQTHLQFLSRILPSLERVRVFDPDSGVVDSLFNSDAVLKTGYRLEAFDDPHLAVAGADVIVTAAPMKDKPLAVIRADDLASGTLCLPLDLDNYFAASAFAKCARKYTDDLEQFKGLQEQGRFSQVDKLDGDYGQLTSGQVQQLRYNSEPVMAISVGIALGDLIIANLIYKMAVQKNVGIWLDL